MDKPGTSPAPLSSPRQQSPSLDYPLGRSGRAILALWSVVLISGFSLAWSLDPDPRGFGTHERLGLPSCSFIRVFNVRCPTCGMTTSFAHFVRADFVASMHANPGGCLMASICAVMIPWCWISIATGRTWKLSEPGTTGIVLLVLIVVTSLLQWLLRYVIPI